LRVLDFEFADQNAPHAAITDVSCSPDEGVCTKCVSVSDRESPPDARALQSTSRSVDRSGSLSVDEPSSAATGVSLGNLSGQSGTLLHSVDYASTECKPNAPAESVAVALEQQLDEEAEAEIAAFRAAWDGLEPPLRDAMQNAARQPKHVQAALARVVAAVADATGAGLDDSERDQSTECYQRPRKPR
jgi:hypothetical protein